MLDYVPPWRNLFGSFFICVQYTYSTTHTYVPTWLYTCYTYIHTNTYQKKRREIHSKIRRCNTYNNTNNSVHLYVPLWIRNFNTCKYVQDSLLIIPVQTWRYPAVRVKSRTTRQTLWPCSGPCCCVRPGRPYLGRLGWAYQSIKSRLYYVFHAVSRPGHFRTHHCRTLARWEWAFRHHPCSGQRKYALLGVPFEPAFLCSYTAIHSLQGWKLSSLWRQ